MADVDIEVAVRESGTAAAISKLEKLREEGKQVSSGFLNLATASRRAFSQIDAEVSKSGRSFVNFDTAVRDTKDGARSLASALNNLEQEYRDLTATALGASAAQRLALGGDGSLQRGINAARTVRQMREALNADPVRDLVAFERQQDQLRSARTRAMEAQGRVAQARWERELASMKPVEAASARLQRATQELATAQRLANLADRKAAANGTEQVYVRQEQAARRLASAIQGLTAAQASLNREQEEHEGNAFQSSYSYFVLAGLAQQASQAVFGLAATSVQATAQIERSFADVERTFDGTDEQLASLQDRLIQLSTETPSSVVDLSSIATLGNQLGIANQDIESFTTTIAKYTAVSGESAESAATAFGRISNLTGLAASQYSNLASAITYTARTTVATESTIQNTAKEISALAAGAGFSAQSIVGLAGALSSLAIPPERARGALSLYFGALNSAVAEGGPKLQAFAELTNMTTDELNNLVRQNRGQEVFQAFIQGLSELDTVAKTTALDTLGLSTIRVDQTMRALAQNVPLVTQSFEGANAAFEQNTEILNQYAIIQDTLDSKWKEFQNAIQNAAAEFGESFAPAARTALEVLTALLREAEKVADSPLGRAFANSAATASILIGVIAALVGTTSLAVASMVVLRFSIKQLGWEAGAAGIRGWIASLVSADRATRATALSTVGLGTAAEGATRKTRLLTGALNLLKVALPLIALTAAFALFDSLAEKFDKLQNPSKMLTEDITGLKDALVLDNKELLSRQVEDLGSAVSRAGGAPLSDFNAAILAAIGMQERAEASFNQTTSAIDGQSLALGKNAREWIAETLKTQEAIKDIIDGTDGGELFNEFLQGFIFGAGGSDLSTADNFISRDDFKKLIEGGLDLNALSQEAVTQGRDTAIESYRAWAMGFDQANPELGNIGLTFGNNVLPGVLDSVIDAYGDAAVEAALSGQAITDSGVAAVNAAADFDELGNYTGDLVENGEALAVTFVGVKSRIDDFRDAIQGAIQGSVGFDSVLKRAQDAAEALAGAGAPAPVDATGFGAALDTSVDEALKFYSDIMRLAEGGNQSFALQLAELGPEAQGILSSALDLDGASQQKLEASARFAAFIASDEFKQTLDAEMSDSNGAYARIFQTTGDLSEVRKAIAAQVAGPEAWAEYERQWALNHPNLPLNVTPELANPTDEELSVWQMQMAGRLKITPVVTNVSPSTGATYSGANQYTDTLTGKSITLPANLDKETLAASLNEFFTGQASSPEEVESKLNTTGWNDDIDNWVKANGPIKVYATLVPTNVGRGQDNRTSSSIPQNRDGGYQSIPRYAGGGELRGPGSNVSDSFLSWVSNGEYITNAAATKFWGTDFMDSLNRKMIPTAFVNMLAGVAAGSGSSGPTHVAHVSLVQQYPTTRDPLRKLQESSEALVAGIWGD